MFTINYHDSLNSITEMRQKILIPKIEKLANINSVYGKPLLSNNDKIFKRCFELKDNELRVVYFYRKNVIHILAIGERSKRKVYNVAKKQLAKIKQIS